MLHLKVLNGMDHYLDHTQYCLRVENTSVMAELCVDPFEVIPFLKYLPFCKQ
jgi:hypothetical protein